MNPATTGGISRGRYAAAMLVAVISDVLSIWTEFVPPMQWALDAATAIALFALLGRRWEILPAMIAEAIPGLAAFPFWIVVVVAVYVQRPERRGPGRNAPTAGA